MANLEPTDEQLLQSVLERPFEPTDVPVEPVEPSKATSQGPILNGNTSHTPSEPATPPEPVGEDPWKAEFEAQVNEWRAKSSEAREKAERERAKWEEVRKHEEEERRVVGQEPETWESLGSHITTSITAASEILTGSTASLVSTPSGTESAETPGIEKAGSTSHDPAPQLTATESVSPSQKWENISSSPGSSFPSISLPDPSTLSSPSPQPNPLPPSYPAADPSKTSDGAKNPQAPPSTIPSITNSAISRRTRLSLVLSSLAINLLLPFVNGVMLGFGEIFAKNVLVGWFGWKLRSGNTAANVGLRR
ncbi:hypothetical protein V8B97DRAFT_2038528 [Scleroderma yunnanense]